MIGDAGKDAAVDQSDALRRVRELCEALDRLVGVAGEFKETPKALKCRQSQALAGAQTADPEPTTVPTI